MKFEERFAELEGIVGRLEREELPLEEALALFEKGIGLVRELSSELDAVERRIEVLLREADGTLRLKPLEDPEDDG
jgi:exodeoxyribonuclease VII small subunit